MQRFLGLDLAWLNTGRTSALAVLEGDRNQVHLVRIFDNLSDDERILSAIAESAISNTALAVDAPLVITNPGGQRQCETEIGRRFGHAHAAAHSSNLGHFPDARGVRLTAKLAADGWRHEVVPLTDQGRVGKWLFEVYPHPAHIVLFDLNRIVKYKKGALPLKRAGLVVLRDLIAKHLTAATPRLSSSPLLDSFLARPLDSLDGTALKAYEDSLDAVLCAFIAAHYWTWGAQRNEMIGTLSAGYIVTPTRTTSGLPWSFASGPRVRTEGGP